MTTAATRIEAAPARASIFSEALSPAAFAALFLALLAICFLPFGLSDPLPLADLPNHIARTYLIHALEPGHPLAPFFAIEWKFLPNLASDLLVPPLMNVVAPDTAMTLFVAVTLILQASGIAMVHRLLFGRWSLFALLVFLLLYNRTFLWGFVNYLFAMGVAFWVFAAWLWLRDRSALVRLPLFTLLTLCLAPLHLYGVALYGVLVGTYEVSRAAERWRTPIPALATLALNALPFVPTLALILTSRTASEGTLVWDGLFRKATGLLEPFNNYSLTLDAATLLLVGGAIALGLATRRVVIHRHMVLCVVTLAVLYMALPTMIFGASAADTRLVPAAAMIAIAAADWRISSLAARRVLMLAALALFVTRMAVIAGQWDEAGRYFDKVRTAIGVIEPAETVAAVVGHLEFPKMSPTLHVTNLVIPDRQAFVNSLFHRPGHQVLNVTFDAVPDAFRGCCQHQYAVPNRSAPDATRLAADPFAAIPLDAFDYVFAIGLQYFPNPAPDRLTPVAEGPDFAIYRVTPEP